MDNETCVYYIGRTVSVGERHESNSLDASSGSSVIVGGGINMRVSTSGLTKASALSATRPTLLVQISFREYTLRSMTYVSSCPMSSHSKTNTI